MRKNNHARIVLSFLFICFLAASHAQPVPPKYTIGIGKQMNFMETAKKELAHPPKIKKFRAPDEREDEEEKIRISNRVEGNIPPFSGTVTKINTQPLNNSLRTEQTEEFPCVTFNALDDSATIIPPDVHGAVGFDHLMVTLNTQVRIQNKQGGTISTVSLLGFFSALNDTDVYDPKIVYDPYDKRWFFVCCANRKSSASALYLAVSQTWDPTGNWNIYTIDADPANQFWFDYPSLGFNRNWITVGGYMFNIPGQSNTQRSRIWVINKSDVYAGLNNINVSYFDQTSYFHISPAVTYDPNDNTNWCVSIFNNNSNNHGYVKLFSITGAQASPVFNVGSTVDVGAAWADDSVAGVQSGSSTGLDLGDNRILQSTFRNGLLWFGNNIFLPATNPTTCAAQVVSINVSSGTATENIQTTVDNTLMYAYPSITVNQNNEVFFGCSAFRSSTYVTSTIFYRRSLQSFFFYYYKPGLDWYVKLDGNNKNRWGDYSATYIDPEDGITAWTVQEYARPRVGGISHWGTWWAKICPGSCSDYFNLSATENNVMHKYEVNGQIVSTSQIQGSSFIKYDAAQIIVLSPGFRASTGVKFQAYIDGCGGNR